MACRFAEITFTDSVKAAQRRYAGREHGGGAATADPRVVLGRREMDFIAARDSFYMASIGEGGWPYVQHRGGPPGFLKVLEAAMLGFADFSGNRQYQSVGNFRHDERVALILVDYPRQRRLKILGRVRVVDAAEAGGGLLARLAPAQYGAAVERLLLIQIEAFDWNCSQHITPRYTESEWRAKSSIHSLSHPSQRSEE